MCVFVCACKGKCVTKHGLTIIMEGSPSCTSLVAIVFIKGRMTIYYSDNLVVDYLITPEVRKESIRYLLVF